jgi:hypothetical protein
MIDQATVRELNRQRTRDAAHEKAEKYHAESEAIRSNSWTAFIGKHSGYHAVQAKDVFYDCVSNRKMIEEYIQNELDVLLDLEALEDAFAELTKQGVLAKPPKQKYQRKTNLAESRIVPQQRSFSPVAKIAPYTRQMLTEMSRSEFRKAVQQFGVNEINRILAQ